MTKPLNHDGKPHCRMKIVIQDIQSGQYLAADETWTGNIRAAKNFRFRPRAISALRLENDRGLRVVYYFEDLDYAIGARHWTDHGWAELCATARTPHSPGMASSSSKASCNGWQV